MRYPEKSFRWLRDTNYLIIPMTLFCGMSKGVFSLVWLAFILFHICLVHFLKKISPLQLRRIPQKRKNNEIELRFTFKMYLDYSRDYSRLFRRFFSALSYMAESIVQRQIIWKNKSSNEFSGEQWLTTSSKS